MTCYKTAYLAKNYLDDLEIPAEVRRNEHTGHTYFVFQDRQSGKWFGLIHGDDPYHHSKREYSAHDLIKTADEIEETWRLVGKLREEMESYFLAMMSDESQTNKADMVIHELALEWAADKMLIFDAVLKPEYADSTHWRLPEGSNSDLDDGHFATHATISVPIAELLDQLPLPLLARVALYDSPEALARVDYEWNWDHEEKRFERFSTVRNRYLVWDQQRRDDIASDLLKREVKSGLATFFEGSERSTPFKTFLTRDRLKSASFRERFEVKALPSIGDLQTAIQASRSVLMHWTAEQIVKNVMGSSHFSEADMVLGSQTLSEEEKARYPISIHE